MRGKRQYSYDFSRDFHAIADRINYEGAVAGKIAYLDFAVSTLCRELAAESAAKHIRAETVSSRLDIIPPQIFLVISSKSV